MHEDATAGLNNGYRAMAANQTREAEAMAWCDALARSTAADEVPIKTLPCTDSKTNVRASDST